MVDYNVTFRYIYSTNAPNAYDVTSWHLLVHGGGVVHGPTDMWAKLRSWWSSLTGRNVHIIWLNSEECAIRIIGIKIELGEPEQTQIRPCLQSCTGHRGELLDDAERWSLMPWLNRKYDVSHSIHLVVLSGDIELNCKKIKPVGGAIHWINFPYLVLASVCMVCHLQMPRGQN